MVKNIRVHLTLYCYMYQNTVLIQLDCVSFKSTFLHFKFKIFCFKGTKIAHSSIKSENELRFFRALKIQYNTCTDQDLDKISTKPWAGPLKCSSVDFNSDMPFNYSFNEMSIQIQTAIKMAIECHLHLAPFYYIRI